MMRERVDQIGSRRARTIGVTVLTVLLLAAGAVTLMGGRYGAAAGRPSFDLTSGLLLSTRTDLQVCVESAPDETGGTAVPRIQAALGALSHEPVFAAGYGSLEPHVVLRCPQSASLLASGQRHVKAGGTFAAGSVTTDPSPYRLFVYVVPPAEITRMFGTLPFHFASQEVFCERGSCATVTTALYVDPLTLLDDSRLAAELQQALGLRPPYPDSAAPGHPKEMK